MDTLYKYKKLKHFEYFMDMLITRRLYGATFRELNDPMEGYFISENFDNSEWETMKNTRKRVRICSLSKNYNNALMWAHYADEHKGCCIELEVPDDTKWIRLDMQYQSSMPKLSSGIDSKEAIKQIFGIKSNFWSYEKEVRFIKLVKQTTEGKPYKANLPIRIKKIYLGIRVPLDVKNRIERIVKAVDSNIDVIKIRQDNINFWDINK